MLLPHGNIGIGTLSPSQRLEVIGNVRISEGLEVQNINVVGLSATNLTISEDIQVGRNILVDGNIGIGVQNPTERLEISGNLRVNNQIFTEGIETNAFLGQSGAFGQQLNVGELFTVEGLTGLGIPAPVERLEVAGNVKATGDFLGQNLVVAEGIQSQTLETASGVVAGPLVVEGTTFLGGNTGLGIESPSEKLEVEGNIKATGDFHGQNIFAEQGIFAGQLTVGQNLAVSGVTAFTGEVSMDGLSVSDTLHSQVLKSENGAVKGEFSVGGPMSLGSTLLVKGTLGIGTDKVAGYMLSVNGKIRAGDDIRVYSSVEWADFVFQEAYPLRSLQEVERYIKIHQHLPEIPSALTVKEEGFELGAMDAKLLQKIEELTLYTIAQEKAITQQKELFEQKNQEMEALRAELEELKVLVKALAESK